jgi:heptosyltransferase III
VQKKILAQPKKILVIRRDNIGDLVCTTPAFAALRKHHPNSQIGALVNSYNAEVMRGNPNVDHVFVYQKLKHAGSLSNRIKALLERFRLIIKLRRWRPDVTILAKSSYDRHGLNFARQIGAKNIIGFVPDDLRHAKSLPDIRLRTPEFTTVHEVEAVNQLLIPLGVNDALGSLQVFPDVGAVEKLVSQLPAAEYRIALHISARELERRWGLDNFVALTKHLLITRANSQVLLFWSPGNTADPHHPGDDEAAADLMKSVQSSRLIPMPTKNLTELIAALSLCDLFIGTDGGAMHLAAGLNKKVIALFENKPDKLKHWYPWRVINRVVNTPNTMNPNICQITLIQVIEALEEMVA